MMGKLRLAGVCLAVLTVIIFALQNTQTAEVSLFAWKIQLPQFILFTALFGGGFLTGAAAFFIIQKRRRR